MSLDCEWEVNRNSMVDIAGTSKTCAIQIACADNFSNAKCALL